MIIGLRMSKSALASYAEQVGIVVPFTFDVFVLNREFLKTDAIGLGLIVFLQAYQAYKSTVNAKEEIKAEKDDVLLDKQSLVSEHAAKNLEDMEDGYKKQIN